MKKKYLFIINPVAGKGKHLSILSEISSFFASEDVDFDTVITQRPKQATQIAKDSSNKYEILVAVGGDGTVNEIINGLAISPAILGILPIGSGNDFSYQLGYKRNLKRDLRILREAKTKWIDVGVVNETDYFINGFGVGFDGETALAARKTMRYTNGFMAYLLAVLRTLVFYRCQEVKMKFDDRNTVEQKILFISVCNGTTYGGGFKVAPDAKMDDGLFDVCLVDKASRAYILRKLPKFIRGHHTNLPEVHMSRCHQLNIQSVKPLQAQLDGELPASQTSYQVGILPKKQEVIFD
ncbi:MAG: diacylglycerol kinase family protein [Patescibacteria group bacterium]|jgi:YegS/Rv2252/BmrU family lipid kinase